MKKWIAGVLAVLAVLAAIAAALLLRGHEPVKTERIQPSSDRDFMQVTLTYDLGTRTLRGRQTLSATNRSGTDLDEIVLRLYMNGWQEESVFVTGVTADGQSVRVEQDEDDPTVLRVKLDWKAGQSVELAWTLMIRHARTDGASLIMLPVLAMLEDGVWRVDPYSPLAQPSYTQAFDYVIDSLTVTQGVQAAMGGELFFYDGRCTYGAQMQGARDVTFALQEGGVWVRGEVCGVPAVVMAKSTGEARRLLERAQTAEKSLRAIGLTYPFSAMTLVRADTPLHDGFAASGLIALTPQQDEEKDVQRLTRLIAQETFGVLVENDPWFDPWLSVSIASAAEMLAYRQRCGVQAYEERFYGDYELATRLTRPHGVTVGASVDFFGSDTEMTQVLRDQGGAMLLGIEQAVGGEAFMRALTLYVRAYEGKTGSEGGLEQALFEASGSRWDGYLSDCLAS